MYGPGNAVDARALKALKAYHFFADGPTYKAETLGGLSQIEFDHAVAAGLLFSPSELELGHDEVGEYVAMQVGRCDPRRVVEPFLASLTTQRLDFRPGLGAFAAARNFPVHNFTALAEGHYCAICGLTPTLNSASRNRSNRVRFVAGGVVGVKPQALAFFIECHLQLHPVKPTEADIALFVNLLNILRKAEPDATAKDGVLKQVTSLKSLKAKKEQVKYILETLGYCGILETKQHGGMLHRYVNLGLAPAKTHSSDWRYPVDFWTGKDGLNKEAIRFWFGDYTPLREFMS